MALHRAGRLAEAEAGYRRVLEADGGHHNALHLLGVLRLGQGRADAAAELLGQAVRANPAAPASHIALGSALAALGHHEAALAAFKQAVSLAPASVEAVNGQANALFALDRLGEALSAYERAAVLAPGDAIPHHNVGLTLARLRRPAEAAAAFERALARSPGLADSHVSRAVALNAIGRSEEALVSLEAALALRPDDPEARFLRSYPHMVAGRLEQGWPDYEYRASRGRLTDYVLDPALRWSGPDIPVGRRLFVHHEQGLGDTLQFSRYARLLCEAGADVTLSAQTPLLGLLTQMHPRLRLIGPEQPPPPHDLHCSLMSLPMALGTTLNSIPPAAPYLTADAARSAMFADTLGPRRRPRVGLAWSGKPAQADDADRSMAFTRLAPLLDPAVDWVCVQDRIRDSDASAVAADGRVRFLGHALKDFSDTAALIDQLDLVISVCTSVAHLAGAMGRPVWIMLPFRADWRWFKDREESPWYPTARLFRQPAPGDWDSVIGRLAAEVGRL